jgi:NADH-quinone oxidoreductase subunit I
MPGSWYTRLYLPEVAKGLANTFRRLVRRPKFTIEYDATPQGERHEAREGYRGEHYLKRDEKGRVKCVACFMCAGACPAYCIHIEAGESPPEWADRDKVPVRFEIDLLRCIYCGYCEEACPVDAIALSRTFNIVSTTREQKIYDLDRLLANGDREAKGRSIGPTEGEHRGARLDR